MKPLTLLIASVLANCSGMPYAADANSRASAYSSMAKPERAAQSVKNDRMQKCAAMHGDDKKGCEQTASADARRAMKNAKEDQKDKTRSKSK